MPLCKAYRLKKQKVITNIIDSFISPSSAAGGDFSSRGSGKIILELWCVLKGYGSRYFAFGTPERCFEYTSVDESIAITLYKNHTIRRISSVAEITSDYAEYIVYGIYLTPLLDRNMVGSSLKGIT